ncbi:MAG: hypothetical protein U5L45_13430 [Saprospiraceae bacterium]|nr:hypothetical protein [Saprospiraceae bacterium]
MIKNRCFALRSREMQKTLLGYAHPSFITNYLTIRREDFFA